MSTGAKRTRGRLTARDIRALLAAVESATQNEREFVNCQYNFGRCIDPEAVRKTRALIRQMARARTKLRVMLAETSKP
jgi:hypothetical protein